MARKLITRNSNTQWAYSYANYLGDRRRENAISDAWDKCESIDPYCEWGDHDLDHLIVWLRKWGETELADKLEEQLDPVFKPVAIDEDMLYRLRDKELDLAVWLGYSNRNDQHEIEVRRATLAGFETALEVLGIKPGC